MFKKKASLASLALMLSLSVGLTACGSNEGGKSSNAAKEEAAVQNDGTIDASKLEPVALKMYTIGPNQKDLPMVQEEINKYLTEKINATIDINMIDWGDYSQRMQVITSSGENYDIAFTSSWAFDYLPNVSKGAFLPLNDLLDKYGKGIKEELDPRFLEGTKVDGVNYAIPANKELAQQYVWRFNKKYLDKHNLDISKVTTLEDLEPLLKTIKDNEPADITPLAVPKSFKPYLPVAYLLGDEIPIGMDLDTKDFKFNNILGSPELKSALTTMRKYYKDGYLREDVATLEGIDNIKTGKWLVDREIIQPYADLGWSRNAGYDIVARPMQDPVIYTSSAAGSMMAISAYSKNPERAMMFLNLLNTDAKLRNMIQYGLEGTHYKKLDDQYIEDLPAMQANYAMPGFALGNMYLTYLHKDEPTDKWDAFQKFNSSAKVAPTFGFNFNTDPVKTEVAAVTNVAKEFIPALYTGSVDPDEYLKKAEQKFKDAGIDKVITEAQKQFDEWKAQNK
ncbi:ABC transporter substrate-binding protein [Paenibacillus sp.]|jgi:putative aldouronate transport system substrate-binding protein|uniref:ABC transporter substrate-binding protein n=1 Tax=Paenibacillus sp. TaxID=58172 RepID=UPI00281AC6D6|nr:ABC transporter substrate-binding protein [Paenibacillus sp.]MDR0271220.1 ABC transporter substrate-binding protein [Paenibacillus sp.]